MVGSGPRSSVVRHSVGPAVLCPLARDSRSAALGGPVLSPSRGRSAPRQLSLARCFADKTGPPSASAGKASGTSTAILRPDRQFGGFPGPPTPSDRPGPPGRLAVLLGFVLLRAASISRPCFRPLLVGPLRGPPRAPASLAVLPGLGLFCCQLVTMKVIWPVVPWRSLPAYIHKKFAKVRGSF